MAMDFGTTVLAHATADLIGVFAGAMAALATDRRNAIRVKRKRAETLLRILTKELNENYEALRAVKTAYETTPWGKSCYVSTIAWETALAGGDLQEILGYELSDRLAVQYGWLARIRYYIDLLTQLWFAPRDISGYSDIQHGFRQNIMAAMEEAFTGHEELMAYIRKVEPSL